MSLLYIVDGYNAIHRLKQSGSKETSDERLSFLSYLSSSRPQGSINNRLIIVFDGFFSLSGNFGCEVVFSESITADDKIREIVKKLPQVKNVIVITDDRDLGFSARNLGARWMSVSDFFKKPNSGCRKIGSKKVSSDFSEKADLNIVQREAITEELKGIWLKKKP